MNKDIRISVSFLDHPKTIKLKRLLGLEGIESLLRLWCFAAQYKPNGKLDNMDEADIEIAARWNGKSGAFIKALLEYRWLEKDGETYILHDWQEHNPYCARAQERSAIAKKAAEARWRRKTESRLCSEHAESNAECSAGCMLDECSEECSEYAEGSTSCSAERNAPSPSPIPFPPPAPAPDSSDYHSLTSFENDSCRQSSPSAKPSEALSTCEPSTENGEKTSPRKKNSRKGKDNGTAPSCPHQAIIDLYHEVLPELPRVKVWNATRQKLLQARWREDPEHQSLDFWRDYFNLVRESDFLMGRVPGSNGRFFQATLEWLVRPTNFAKVLEGFYSNRPVVSRTMAHNLQVLANIKRKSSNPEAIKTPFDRIFKKERTLRGDGDDAE